ncbi:MinD/ParA family protein, partial [Streptomyces sp. SID7909]|nr:MinD/ParA family protein [Streptomyces sp. SID7909]
MPNADHNWQGDLLRDLKSTGPAGAGTPADPRPSVPPARP